MSDGQETRLKQLPSGTYDLQSLWEKYEDIAMHFNDLLMRLRTQALAGIAAISTLVGIFTKADPTAIQSDWLIAEAIFVALTLFWIAIFCLDFFYYNRLLVGAVAALKELEAEARSAQFTGIKMSTRIIEEFNSGWQPTDTSSFTGVFIFYGIVLAVLVSAAVFSCYMRAAP